MNVSLYVELFIAGTIIGSFVGALTYRIPRGIDIVKGRSKCPSCKKTIAWYDNVPLISYIILKGRCRKCSLIISRRYFIIELATGLYFLFLYFLSKTFFCSASMSPYCSWVDVLGKNSFLLNIFIFLILFSIFIIDIEKQVIPDTLIFWGISIAAGLIILFFPNAFYFSIFSGLIAASFLLFINLFTKGKGMGLGDVKLAIFAGLLLVWPLIGIWLFIAFLTGAIVGIILILGRKTSFGKSIAFGPFLVFSFFLVYFLGDKILPLLFR